MSFTTVLVSEEAEATGNDWDGGERRERVVQQFDDPLDYEDKEPHGVWDSGTEVPEEQSETLIEDEDDFSPEGRDGTTYRREDGLRLGHYYDQPDNMPPDSYFRFEDDVDEEDMVVDDWVSDRQLNMVGDEFYEKYYYEFDDEEGTWGNTDYDDELDVTQDITLQAVVDNEPPYQYPEQGDIIGNYGQYGIMESYDYGEGTTSTDHDSDFAGGDGSSDNPYQIENIHQLQNIKDEGDVSSHYELIDDIDAYETRFWNDGKGFEPIEGQGSLGSELAFYGDFDGNGHVIKDLYINRPNENYVGLFNILGYDEDWENRGMVRDVGFISPHITGGLHVGTIAGMMRDSTHIRETYVVDGRILSSDEEADESWDDVDEPSVGSFVGQMSHGTEDAIINISYSSSTVEIVESFDSEAEETFAGGIIGRMQTEWSSLWSLYSTTHVSGADSNGGITGSFYFGATLEDLYYNEETSGDASDIGAEPRTTSEMTYPYVDTFENFDFDNMWQGDDGETDDWRTDYVDNYGYPALSFEQEPEYNIVAFTVQDDGCVNIVSFDKDILNGVFSFVVTYDGDEIVTYVNGDETNTESTGGSSDLNSEDENFKLGRNIKYPSDTELWEDYDDRFWGGANNKYYSARFLSSVLSQSEVDDIDDRFHEQGDEELWLKFVEGEQDVGDHWLEDYSGNELHTSLMNGEWDTHDAWYVEKEPDFDYEAEGLYNSEGVELNDGFLSHGEGATHGEDLPITGDEWIIDFNMQEFDWGYDIHPSAQLFRYEGSDGSLISISRFYTVPDMAEIVVRDSDGTQHWGTYEEIEDSNHFLIAYDGTTLSYQGSRGQDMETVDRDFNFDWSGAEMQVGYRTDGIIDELRIWDGCQDDIEQDGKFHGQVGDGSYQDTFTFAKGGYNKAEYEFESVSGLDVEVTFDYYDDGSDVGTESFVLDATGIEYLDVPSFDEIELTVELEGGADNLKTSYFYGISIMEEFGSTAYSSVYDDYQVDGLHSYSMYMFDDHIGSSVSGYMSWTNAPENLDDWDSEPLSPFSIHSVGGYLRYEESGTPEDNDNQINIYQVNRFYEDGEVSDVEISLEYEIDKFDEGVWNDFGFGTPHTGWDATGFLIEIETDEDWEGEFEVWVDRISHVYRVTEVFPRMYNKFTGEGISQDRLIVQYEDEQDDWRFISGDSFHWVQRSEVDIRVMDFWGQVVWEDTVVPYEHEKIVRIPIPIIVLRISRPDVIEDDSSRWYLETPWFTIGSQETGETKQVQEWEMEVVGGREYKFVWDSFAHFLGGSQLVDMGFHMDTPVTPFPSGTTETMDSNDDEDGIETNDTYVSDIRGGQAILDLTLNIDPEKRIGRPPLHLNPIEWAGGDSDHWQYFPEHQLTAMAYDLFGLPYESYDPYRDDFPKDYVVAIFNDSYFFHVLGGVVVILGLLWYIEVFTGAIKITRRARMEDSEGNKSLSESAVEKDRISDWFGGG